MSDLVNEVTARGIVDRVAQAAVERFAQTHPVKAEIPAPLKWAAGVATAVITALVVSMCVWMAGTLNGLQQTVTRIDERQQITGDSTGSRLDRIEERLTRLERGAGVNRGDEG